MKKIENETNILKNTQFLLLSSADDDSVVETITIFKESQKLYINISYFLFFMFESMTSIWSM